MKSTYKQSRLAKLLVTVTATAALILGTSAVLQAGQNKGGYSDHQRSGKMQQRLYEKLDLSEAQKAQINSIRESYKPQFETLRNSRKALIDQNIDLDPASENYVASMQATSAVKSQFMQQSATLRAQMQHDMALVLTAEQRAEMATLKAERRARKQERSEDRKQRREDKGNFE